MKSILEMHGRGQSIRSISAELGLSRNTVRKYLREPGLPRYGPRPARPRKLEPFAPFVRQRMSEGVRNGVVLMRELRARGYGGGYTTLKTFVQPLRPPKTERATMRFETMPGEQAQVDWGRFAFIDVEGERKLLWAFVMVLSWSRAMYLEFVERADVATFMACHVRAFEHFGGVPLRCLYDNQKLVVLGRDEGGAPAWNERFLDFALRVGFESKLCRPYRAQTKGRVESGIKYVRGNFWPSERFVDLSDLNRHAQTWVAEVADRRIHGTTGVMPGERLEQERDALRPFVGRERLLDLLQESRKVARDGFVQWAGSHYGVPATLAGQEVFVAPSEDRIEIWSTRERVAVHPRSWKRGARHILPGQWTDLRQPDDRPATEAIARQLPTIDVQARSLALYDAVTAGAL